MDADILKFIKKQTCATIATAGEKGEPYCFHVFYVIDADNMRLYYKTSNESYHALLMMKNTKIAGAILPDKLNKLMIKGIQFEGVVLHEEDPVVKNASSYYHKKNPLGLAVPGTIWVLQIDHIKMTDNTKGFGTKLHWYREKNAAAK